MHTNMFATKTALTSGIDLLLRKEEARRIIAISTGDELHKAMDACGRANTDHLSKTWLDTISEKSESFSTAMKEWRESVAELQEARFYLREFYK